MAEPVETTATPSQLEDPRLSELEQQVLAKFQSNTTGEPEGYAQMVGAADEPVPVDEPTEATPPPSPHPSAPASASDAVSSPPPAAEVPPADPRTPDLSGVDASEDGTLATWEEWDDDTKSQAVRVAEWATGLTEEAQLQIDAVLSGQYALVPVEDVPKITEFYQAQQNSPPPSPAAPGTPAPEYNPYTLDEPVDPRVAQLEAQVQQLAQAQNQTVEQQQIAYQRDAINTGSDAWFASHSDLTSSERDRLSAWVVRSGMYAGFAQTLPPERAVQAALDSALSQDATIQARRTDEIVAQRLAEEREAAVSQQERARAQSAISGSGASSPGVPQIMDPDAAMVAMVQAAMESGS
jgi:hypothetical protein